MRFLKLGALAMSLAAFSTQQADAAGYAKLSFGFNFCWEVQGCDRERCVYRSHASHAHHGQHGQHPEFVAVMPGQPHAQPQPAPWQQAPPPLPQRPGERKQEEIMLEWGYPGLGYSYYHPVSYQQPQQTEAPTYYYYVPQSYNPPAYWYPGSYGTPGVTFDR